MSEPKMVTMVAVNEEKLQKIIDRGESVHQQLADAALKAIATIARASLEAHEVGLEDCWENSFQNALLQIADLAELVGMSDTYHDLRCLVHRAKQNTESSSTAAAEIVQ